MWLLNVQTHRLEAFEGDSIPQYAILSHRWEEDEVLFADMIERCHETRRGWQKIKSCCEYAYARGLYYVWADTCCIDKKSSAELSEAINSMFQWYRQATTCYAYLYDVTDPVTFTESEWFTRGWTLQELLAPVHLLFFDKEWNCIGPRFKHLKALSERTGIHSHYLEHFYHRGRSDSIAQIMSWAARRRTSRIEDRAYSLMGLFNVNMPLLYGEGSKAFTRLQKEIMKNSDDMSIFAWRGESTPGFRMLAASPEGFAHCGEFLKLARKYDITKHEIIVGTRIHSEIIKGRTDPYYAMPVAFRLGSDRKSHLVCILLSKYEKDSRYYRAPLYDYFHFRELEADDSDATKWEPIKIDTYKQNHHDI